MSESSRESLVQLFVDNRRALSRYVRRLVRSQEIAEDVVQEAFLRTCEHADQARVPRALLFTVARNLAMDAHRRDLVVRRAAALGDWDPSDVVSPGHSPEGQSLVDEETRLLKEAIEHLTPQCRAVLVLKVFHACSYQEIAHRLSLAPKTVENHIARGLREVRSYLRRRYR